MKMKRWSVVGMVTMWAVYFAPFAWAGHLGPLGALHIEVQDGAQAGPASGIVDLGSKAGVRVGQTVEIRRSEKVVGYGSVLKVFKEQSVATIGTIVSSGTTAIATTTTTGRCGTLSGCDAPSRRYAATPLRTSSTSTSRRTSLRGIAGPVSATTW